MLDPAAPLRQAQWDTAIATLREIDPSNRNLTYFSSPGSAPSQEALDRINAAVEAAAIKRVTDKVKPDGVPIGKPGRSLDVRELPGGLGAARDLFAYLRVGATVHSSDAKLTIVRLPGNAGFVTFRSVSTSGSPAVDINLPEAAFFMRVHFP
jgi:hypothetical protein